jgi:hypothetical protein
MRSARTKTNQDFIQDRQQIRDAFTRISASVELVKAKILEKNPHAFDHLHMHVNENRRNK